MSSIRLDKASTAWMAEDLFPKAPDQHKSGKPLVPNGLGIVYVLSSSLYLFILYYFGFEDALALAVCILFGGFLGLLDDWMDLRWRYKAFLPLFASLPLATLRQGNPWMATYFFGWRNFGLLFYFIVIPVIVTITTNVVNQLGGLNGLETICPSIILTGLMLASGAKMVLLFAPLATYLLLAVFNFQGKIFVGNTGTFAVGITLASYAIVANVEQTLLVSILPYIFNASLILLNFFLFRKSPSLILEGATLKSKHRRSLLTTIAYYFPNKERIIVCIVAFIFVLSTVSAVLLSMFAAA